MTSTLRWKPARTVGEPPVNPTPEGARPTQLAASLAGDSGGDRPQPTSAGSEIPLRALELIGRSPRSLVRTVGAGIDLLTFTGPAYLLRRRREQAALQALGGELKRTLYRRVWAEAATELGADLHELPGDLTELRKDGASVRVQWDQVMLDDAATIELALDKTAVEELLAGASLPVPDSVALTYTELARAERLLDDGGGPLVVKPTSGTGGGDGVTAGIERRADLLRASLRASRSDPRLIVQRQLAGDMHRILLLDGELVDVIRSRPPRVTGDGRSSIADLIAADNQRRLNGAGVEGLKLLLVDLDCAITLARQGMSLSTRPGRGETVQVKQATNQNAPRDNESIGTAISDDLARQARAAAGIVGLRLAGVDVVTPDASKPMADTGGAIIEVNGNPGLHHHYLVSHPEQATKVTVPILRTLLGEAWG